MSHTPEGRPTPEAQPGSRTGPAEASLKLERQLGAHSATQKEKIKYFYTGLRPNKNKNFQ